MIDPNNIILTEEEIDMCLCFANNSAPTQQNIEFGQHDIRARSVSEVSRDTIIGKIAEVAFAKLLYENYNLPIQLDFNIYERTKYDDQDALINGWRIDVKGTRQGGHYLLVEWNKLDFRQIENRLSHIYTMFSVGWDREHDCPSRIVKYAGAVTLRALRPGVKWTDTKVLLKGDFIPGTRTVLQADNYGIEFNDLNKDLDGLVRVMTGRKPDASVEYNYKNPYTNEPTFKIIQSDESKERHRDWVKAYLESHNRRF